MKVQNALITYLILLSGLSLLIYAFLKLTHNPNTLEEYKPLTCQRYEMYLLGFTCDELRREMVLVYELNSSKSLVSLITNASLYNTSIFHSSDRFEVKVKVEVTQFILPAILKRDFENKTVYNISLTCGQFEQSDSNRCLLTELRLSDEPSKLSHYFLFFKVVNLEELDAQGIKSISLSLFTQESQLIEEIHLFRVTLVIFSIIFLIVLNVLGHEVTIISTTLILFNSLPFSLSGSGKETLDFMKYQRNLCLIFSGHITLLLLYFWVFNIIRMSDIKSLKFKIPGYVLTLGHWVSSFQTMYTCLLDTQRQTWIKLGDDNFRDSNMWGKILIINILLMICWSIGSFPRIWRRSRNEVLDVKEMQIFLNSFFFITLYVSFIVHASYYNPVTLEAFRAVVAFFTIILRTFSTKTDSVGYQVLPKVGA